MFRVLNECHLDHFVLSSWIFPYVNLMAYHVSSILLNIPGFLNKLALFYDFIIQCVESRSRLADLRIFRFQLPPATLPPMRDNRVGCYPYRGIDNQIISKLDVNYCRRAS